MEKSTWRLFVTVNGPRCVDGSWPPSLTRYLPVIRWRYASRRHREVALCHGALFRFVCSLASINHVLSLPHPQFRAPRRCNPAPFSFLRRIFRPPPPLFFTVSRARCTGNGFIRRFRRNARRLDDASRMNLEKMRFLDFACVILWGRGGEMNVVCKIERWLFELIGYRYEKKLRKMTHLLYVDIAQCNNVDFED